MLIMVTKRAVINYMVLIMTHRDVAQSD